jgi:ribonuclease HI
LIRICKTEKRHWIWGVLPRDKEKLSFRFGKYRTVFQAEAYAIKTCAVEDLDKDYKNRNIYILSHSKAAIKTLGKFQITSQLILDCHQSIIQLGRHNRVQTIWVPGHDGIAGNESTDLHARTVCEHPFTGPEPACGISIGVAKRAVRDWTNRNRITMGIHKWTQTGKGTYQDPLPEEQRAVDRLRRIVGLLEDTVI